MKHVYVQRVDATKQSPVAMAAAMAVAMAEAMMMAVAMAVATAMALGMAVTIAVPVAMALAMAVAMALAIAATQPQSAATGPSHMRATLPGANTRCRARQARGKPCNCDRCSSFAPRLATQVEVSYAAASL